MVGIRYFGIRDKGARRRKDKPSPKNLVEYKMLNILQIQYGIYNLCNK